MIYPNVTINGIDMIKTYKMALADRSGVQPPEPKTLYKDIPGADGSLDLSTAVSGHTVYNRRTITLIFGCGYDIEKWPKVFSEILHLFHGKQGRLIFDDDPLYCYIGRMTVSDYSRLQQFGTFTLTMNADPYKYELYASDEDWPWDVLNFENGIIREFQNLEVNEGLILKIPGTEKWIVPTITASTDMTVEFDGKTYELKPGQNKVYGIVLKEGENELIFRGTGTVTISYRGGIL